MNTTMEHLDANRTCVKITKGNKELSISFRRIGENRKAFVDSVGLFEEGKKDQFFNNVYGINDMGSFFEWLNQ